MAWDSNLGLQQHALAWDRSPWAGGCQGRGHAPRNEVKQYSKALSALQFSKGFLEPSTRMGLTRRTEVTLHTQGPQTYTEP